MDHAKYEQSVTSLAVSVAHRFTACLVLGSYNVQGGLLVLVEFSDNTIKAI